MSGTHHVSSKVRSHSESAHDTLGSMSFKSAPLQRSLIMQTSSPTAQPFPKPAKHLGSSYARSLISNCTSSPIRQSVSTPMGECRQRSPVSINVANGEIDLAVRGNEVKRMLRHLQTLALVLNVFKCKSYIGNCLATHPACTAKCSRHIS